MEYPQLPRHQKISRASSAFISSIRIDCDEQRLQKQRVDRRFCLLWTQSRFRVALASAGTCRHDRFRRCSGDALAFAHAFEEVIRHSDRRKSKNTGCLSLHVRGHSCVDNFLRAQASKHLRSNLMADTVNPASLAVNWPTSSEASGSGLHWERSFALE